MCSGYKRGTWILDFLGDIEQNNLFKNYESYVFLLQRQLEPGNAVIASSGQNIIKL